MLALPESIWLLPFVAALALLPPVEGEAFRHTVAFRRDADAPIRFSALAL
jgi:hypothetical protein